MNGVILQSFHWHTNGEGTLWFELTGQAAALARAGFSAIWLPPTYKGAYGTNSVGYDAYDLFDLGEFDQKGSVRTKYGTKEQLLAAIQSLQAEGIQVYADVVFNHKDGADQRELVWGQVVRWDDRNVSVGDWQEFSAWTKFTFPGRNNLYSSRQWSWTYFDALTFNADTNDQSRLYRLKDKTFSTEVSHEHGNYDYLLANDLDLGMVPVQEELRSWGEWFLTTTGVDGFRLDACKHIRASFFPTWLDTLRQKFGREIFSVGEYWSGWVGDLLRYLEVTGGALSLFDVPLHYRFAEASRRAENFDLRGIFAGTLVAARPEKAVTFVENHDTQPCQSLESTVEPWFKPLAYALILLRREGYPCVFYADYYGAEYPNCREHQPPVKLYSHRWLLDKFLWVRQMCGYGEQLDYFDHPATIGWTRLGDAGHPQPMAVLINNGSEEGRKWMYVGRPGAQFYDLTEHIPQKVAINEQGWGEFLCPSRLVSVWLPVEEV